MNRQTLRIALAGLVASTACSLANSAAAQSAGGLSFDPAISETSSSSTVIVAMRPFVPTAQQTTVPPAGVPQPPASGVKDGTGKDDVVKTAQDRSAPTNDSGSLSPITMESVRAPISAVDISIDAIGTRIVPEDQASKLALGTLALPGGQDRGFGCLTYRWQATNLHHWPLYFEEPMLERHGQQFAYPALQPAISGSKFLGNVFLYPYKATLQPALESRYALGHFRPGSNAPLLKDTLPWSPRAALVQGAAVTAVGVGLPW